MTPAGCWAVLPVKPFGAAKSRLDGALEPGARRQFARRMMLASLSALLDSGCFERVLVVSPDETALSLAREAGALALAERGTRGLNQALAEAREAALAAGTESLLVLASDLPLVTPGDIVRVVEAAREVDVVIVPDRRREGTNCLLLRPPDAIDFAFGESSCRRHLELARDRGLTASVLSLERLGLDIDMPEDLLQLEQARLGSLTGDAPDLMETPPASPRSAL